MEQKNDTIMSKAFYKAEIRYDNNDSTTSEQTLYVYCDNTSDFEYVMNEKGQTVDCGGTDSYMTVLKKVMALEEYYGPGSEHVKITRLENGSADLPQAVREYLEVGAMFQQLRVWHPKTERPDDESQILIDEGDGFGTAGTYYADGDMLAAAAGGIAADWENWRMDRWAYISDLVPKKEKKD